MFVVEEFNVNWTADAAAANCEDGEEIEGEARPADEDDLDEEADDEEELDEKDEHGEDFLLKFVLIEVVPPPSKLFGFAVVIETTKTPLGTGGFELLLALLEHNDWFWAWFDRLVSDKRFEWCLILST